MVPPNSSRARDLDFQLVKKIVAEAPPLGIEYIGLTGGEPMLHPRFLDILDAIVDGGLGYHFLSNGLRPARPDASAAWPDPSGERACGASASSGRLYRGHPRSDPWQGNLPGYAGRDRRSEGHGDPVHAAGHGEQDQPPRDRTDGLFAHNLGATALYYTHFFPTAVPHATEDMDLTIAERHEAEAIIRRLTGALRLPITMGEGYYVPKRTTNAVP